MKKKIRTSAAIVSAAFLALGLAACGSSTDSSSASASSASSSVSEASAASKAPESSETASSADGEKKTITVGSIAYNQDEVLAEPAITALEEAGYEVESLVFENATVMNEAILEGSLDASLHQHQPFLDAYNESKGTDLVMLTPYVHYNQFSLMSEKYDSVEEIPDGATIVVSDDSANQARGLLFLQELGLITLTEGIDLPTTLDVVENPHNFNITVVAHHQVVNSLPDVDAALTSTFLLYSNGGGEDEIIATSDDLTDYGVGFVVAKENADSDWAQALVAAYTTEEMSEAISEIFDGGYVPGYEIQAE